MTAFIKNLFTIQRLKKRYFLPILGIALFRPLVAQAFKFPDNWLGFEWDPFGIFRTITDPLAAPLGTALVAFFNGVFAAFALLLQGIYIGIGEILIQITTYFIEIPVAPGNPNTPDFIREAWGFSLTLVNGIFLLILVFIGLATILRIQSYQIQRILPGLILITLLVNFSGVLVGLVVDVANILTNFFLRSVGGVGSLYATNPWEAFAPNPENLGQNIARILFYIVGILIYGAIMLIFGLRVIVLWTLTVLAPIAFAAYILPATRRFWNQWLSALIQWAFVGVPISFFLFLAGQAIAMDLPGASSSGLDSTVTDVFAPLTALFLLLVGIGISMSMAPASVRGVGNFVRKAAIVTTGVLGAKAIVKTMESKLGEGARKGAERLGGSANPTWGLKDDGTKKGGLGFIARAGANVAGYGKRSTGKFVQDRFVEQEENVKEKARRKAMQQTAPQNESSILQATSKAEKTGFAEGMQAKSGHVKYFLGRDGLSDAEKDSRPLLFTDVHQQYLLEGNEDAAEKTRRNIAHKDNARKEADRQLDDYTANADDKYRDRTGRFLLNADQTERLDEHGNKIELESGITSEEYDSEIKNSLQKTQKSARTENDMRDFSRSLLHNTDFMGAWHDTNIGSAQQASALMRAFGQQGVQAFEDAKKPTEEYFESKQIGMSFKNGKPVPIMGDDSSIVRLEAGAAGQNLGVKPKPGAETTPLVTEQQRVARKLSSILNEQVDAATQETVHKDVLAIFKDMTNPQSKENVLDLISKDSKDPELRKIFQDQTQPDGSVKPGIKDEQDRSNVAEALSNIQDTTKRKDLSEILKKNPHLHHVTPQLEEIKNPAQRREIADVLGKIHTPALRTSTASILRENPDFIKITDSIVDQSHLQIEHDTDQKQLGRSRTTRAKHIVETAPVLRRLQKEIKEAKEIGATTASLEAEIKTIQEETMKSNDNVKALERKVKSNNEQSTALLEELDGFRADNIEKEITPQAERERRLGQWDQLQRLIKPENPAQEGQAPRRGRRGGRQGG